MHITVKNLGTRPHQRYIVRRLVTMAQTILRDEYPDLEVDILEVKTEEEIYKYTYVLIAPGLVINEKMVYDLWIPSKEQVLVWMREAIAEGGAPGILSLVGGTPEEALNYSREMKKITVGVHPTYRMPVLGFAGTPIGIDICLAVQTNITPSIDSAIAHKDPGYPKIEAGLLRAPAECFKKALIAFGKKYNS